MPTEPVVTMSVKEVERVFSTLLHGRIEPILLPAIAQMQDTTRQFGLLTTVIDDLQTAVAALHARLEQLEQPARVYRLHDADLH